MIHTLPFPYPPRSNLFWDDTSEKYSSSEHLIESFVYFSFLESFKEKLFILMKKGILGIVDENSFFLFHQDKCIILCHIISINTFSINFQIRCAEFTSNTPCHIGELNVFVDLQTHDLNKLDIEKSAQFIRSIYSPVASDVTLYGYNYYPIDTCNAFVSLTPEQKSQWISFSLCYWFYMQNESDDSLFNLVTEGGENLINDIKSEIDSIINQFNTQEQENNDDQNNQDQNDIGQNDQNQNNDQQNPENQIDESQYDYSLSDSYSMYSYDEHNNNQNNNNQNSNNQNNNNQNNNNQNNNNQNNNNQNNNNRNNNNQNNNNRNNNNQNNNNQNNNNQNNNNQNNNNQNNNNQNNNNQNNNNQNNNNGANNNLDNDEAEESSDETINFVNDGPFNEEIYESFEFNSQIIHDFLYNSYSIINLMMKKPTKFFTDFLSTIGETGAEKFISEAGMRACLYMFLASSYLAPEPDEIEEVKEFLNQTEEDYIIANNSDLAKNLLEFRDDKNNMAKRFENKCFFSIVKNDKGNKLTFIRKSQSEWNVFKIERHYLRSIWASQCYEVLGLGIRENERLSLQRDTYHLHNLMNQISDIPMSYPAYVSNIEKSYFNLNDLK